MGADNVNSKNLRLIGHEYTGEGAVRLIWAEPTGDFRILETTVPASKLGAACVSGRPAYPYAASAHGSPRTPVTSPAPGNLKLIAHRGEDTVGDVTMLWSELGGDRRVLETTIPREELARFAVQNSEPLLHTQQRAAA